MIQLAGGSYLPQAVKEDDENALSTMNMQMEDFYAQAKDADILIYNSTIEGGSLTVWIPCLRRAHCLLISRR